MSRNTQSADTTTRKRALQYTAMQLAGSKSKSHQQFAQTQVNENESGVQTAGGSERCKDKYLAKSAKRAGAVAATRGIHTSSALQTERHQII